MQLTLRGFDKELESEIKKMARREGISLNRAVLRLLRKATGLGEGPGDESGIGDAIDRFAGTWSDEEAREFESNVGDLDKVDPSLWQ